MAKRAEGSFLCFHCGAARSILSQIHSESYESSNTRSSRALSWCRAPASALGSFGRTVSWPRPRRGWVFLRLRSFLLSSANAAGLPGSNARWNERPSAPGKCRIMRGRALLLTQVVDELRISPDEVSVLQTATMALVRTLKASRAVVYRREDDDAIRVRAQSASEGVAPLQADAVLPPVLASDRELAERLSTSDLTEEADPELRALAERLQVHSIVVVPVGDDYILAVDQCEGPRSWTSTERRFIERFADQLASALTRRSTSRRIGLRLSVEDAGVGMEPTTMQRLFEPFFSTKGEGGTGLGLSVVYEIVNSLGGDVRVKSSPGKGARFDIFVPTKWVEAPRPADGSRRAGARSRRAGSTRRRRERPARAGKRDSRDPRLSGSGSRQW